MNALVLMTDFGLRDRFVASMKGVALNIAPTLPIVDLTHDIAPYNIWEATQTLAHTLPYWKARTVFVAVVDPGVGTEQASVVALTKSNHLIVTPENGTLTLIEQEPGIKEIRKIDKAKYHRPDSTQFHTFHGRDIYAYVGALLASGQLAFKDVGNVYTKPVCRIHIPEADILPDVGLRGAITKTEYPYGNIVSNIPASWTSALEAEADDQPLLQVKILHNQATVFAQAIRLVNSFGFEQVGSPLLYGDSQGYLGLAINQGNFAHTYNIGAGEQWSVEVHKIRQNT